MQAVDSKIGKLISKQLGKVLGDRFAQKDGESREDYIARITKAAAKLGEDEWNGLSEPVQGWVNDNVEAANKKKPQTDYEAQAEDDEADAKATKVKATKAKAKAKADEDDDEDDEAEDDEAEDDEADDDEADDDEAETKAAKAKAAKAKAKPAAEKAKAKPARDSDAKAGGVGVMVKMIIRHPDWKKAKLLEELSKKDFTISDGTANTVYYHTRNTLRVLKEMGKLGDD